MNHSNSNQPPSRRSIAYVSLLGTTQLHLRNPFIIACWSVIFPGLGHMLLSKYIRGYLLFIWEVIINYKAHINLVILYSLTGDFETAKEVVDIRWMALYIPTYIFGIWDSYRTTVDLNHQYILAAREDAEIKPFKIGAMEINYLDKRNPWVAAVWSILIPGAGQLYIHRVVTALFVVGWWIVVCYCSNLLPAFHYSLLGDFVQAREVVDKHWYLNVVSIFMFPIYDAYVNTVENNKLYEWEQNKFFRRDYQNRKFPMPFKRKNEKGDNMYIVSTFEHSKYLEMAVTALQMKGIAKENILAVPMDKRGEDRALFDSVHHSDGLSLLDFPAALGTLLGIFGSVYGFILEWGPFIWGLIGIVSGGVIGLVIRLITTRKYRKNRQSSKQATEVVLIIECKENQLETVKNTLWAHYAFGVSKLDLYNG
jgi:TM2 domain-containing membrane protein YozV